MPEMPRTARGGATSRRILDAAAAEFAERGIAGARVERITSAARTNKAQLYAYFGSKDGLFDAVLADRVNNAGDDVPFDATDMAGWAVAVYDWVLQDPQLRRLIAWTRLERRPTGSWHDSDLPDPKLDEIAAAQAAGRVRAGDPFEVLTMVYALAVAWSPTSTMYAASTDEPPRAHERRRRLLRESVERIVAP